MSLTLQPDFTKSEILSEPAYNNLDVQVTARVAERMEAEGGLKASLFDQALLGPSLTCQLRGWRVDHSKIAETKIKIDQKAVEGKAEFIKLVGSDVRFGKGFKPSPAELSRILYKNFKVRTRLGKTDNPSVAKNILYEILEDPRTPDAAIPVVQLAIDLSNLEEDRKALEKPAGGDGRIHSSFMVSAAVSARWGSRKDCFGEGMNLHSASDMIREIFIPDPGKILVSLDQAQGESKVLAYLAGSQWYIDAHLAGNVHVQAAKVFFPECSVTKQWAKSTPFPSNPLKTYYDIAKTGQHASNYGQSPPGMARLMHIKQAEAQVIQTNYFRQIPEIPAYHRWVAEEIKTKRKLISPMGRVRQFLGRTWEKNSVREAISWQPQSAVSDFTKVLLWRVWNYLDPDLAEVLMEHHDSVLMQVEESKLAEVLPRIFELAQMEIRIGDRVMQPVWEAKVGYNWANMKEWA